MKYSRTLSDAYKSFPNNVTERDSYYADYSTFVNICKEFNKLLIQKLVKEGIKFKMPFLRSYLQIKKGLIPEHLRDRKIDFKKSKELKKQVFHNNNHSSNEYAKYEWKRVGYNIKNRNFYKFTPTRGNKRYLAKEIKENNTIINYETL